MVPKTASDACLLGVSVLILNEVQYNGEFPGVPFIVTVISGSILLPKCSVLLCLSLCMPEMCSIWLKSCLGSA